jgi:hypothetical protein
MIARYAAILLAAVSFSLAACGAPGAIEAGANQQELRGHIDYVDCSQLMMDVLDKATMYGRVVSHSPAFYECLSRKIENQETIHGDGPYRPCHAEKGDPFKDDDPATQYERVLWATSSPNPLLMTCGQDTGALAAGVREYGYSGAEELAVSKETERSVQGHADNPSSCDARCLFHELSFLAESIWHEAMHQQGYTHDEAEPCGYPGDPSYNFSIHSMPYIVGHCVSEVLNESYDVCPDMEGCSRGLNLVTKIDGNECQCVDDNPSPM